MCGGHQDVNSNWCHGKERDDMRKAVSNRRGPGQNPENAGIGKQKRRQGNDCQRGRRDPWRELHLQSQGESEDCRFVHHEVPRSFLWTPTFLLIYIILRFSIALFPLLVCEPHENRVKVCSIFVSSSGMAERFHLIYPVSEL